MDSESMEGHILKLIRGLAQRSMQQETLSIENKEVSINYVPTPPSFYELEKLLRTNKEYTLKVIKEEYIKYQDINILLPLCILMQKLKDQGLTEIFSNSLSIKDKRMFYCSSRALALLNRKDLLPDLYQLAVSSNDMDCKFHYSLSLLCVNDLRAYDLFIELLAYELHHNVIDKARIARIVSGFASNEDRKSRRRRYYCPILMAILCQLFSKVYVKGKLTSDRTIAFYAYWIKYLAENKTNMHSVDISKVSLRFLTTRYQDLLWHRPIVS